jgi:hypothetical protein
MGLESVLGSVYYASILVIANDSVEIELNSFNLLIYRALGGIMKFLVSRVNVVFDNISRETAVLTANRIIEG